MTYIQGTQGTDPDGTEFWYVECTNCGKLIRSGPSPKDAAVAQHRQACLTIPWWEPNDPERGE